MSTVVDHTDEYLCWDDVEAGSVEMTRNGSVISRDIAVMMRGAWNRKIDGTLIQYDGQIVSWSIPDVLLNPGQDEKRTIIRDDVIVGEDGDRFTVLYSEQAVKRSHWYCATVLERS